MSGSVCPWTRPEVASKGFGVQVQDRVQDMVQDLDQVQDLVQDIFFRKIMELGLKWVHNVTRYALILKLDGALWPRIISKPLLTPKTAVKYMYFIMTIHMSPP